MSYKNDMILRVKEELAKQWNCDSKIFDGGKNIFQEDQSKFFQMCTFGKNIYIRGNKEICEWAESKFASDEAKYIMNYDSLFQIEYKLREYGKRLRGEHIRFLYGGSVQVEEPQIGCSFKTFEQGDMPKLFRWKDFNNALNYNSDVIAIGAFDGDKLVALAGADNNMEPLWQIGIDTIPEYRQKGIAVYIVNRLAREIVAKGKIPFYTTWSANIASCRVALSAGLFPGWLEYYSEDIK